MVAIVITSNRFGRGAKTSACRKAALVAAGWTLFSLAACGKDSDGAKCELEPGNWTCTITVQYANSNCNEDLAGSTFGWDMVIAESDDRECSSTTANEGPTYDGANGVYVWMSGNMAAVADDRIKSDRITYRVSDNLNGVGDCVFYGPMLCKP